MRSYRNPFRDGQAEAESEEGMGIPKDLQEVGDPGLSLCAHLCRGCGDRNWAWEGFMEEVAGVEA